MQATRSIARNAVEEGLLQPCRHSSGQPMCSACARRAITGLVLREGPPRLLKRGLRALVRELSPKLSVPPPPLLVAS